MAERQCRKCGCTENNACVTAHGNCHWVSPDLCSECAADDFEEAHGPAPRIELGDDPDLLEEDYDPSYFGEHFVERNT
jgi:hypothetical protein